MIDWQRQNGKLFRAQFVSSIMLQVSEGRQALYKAGHFYGNLSAENLLLYAVDSEPTTQKIDIQELSDTQMRMMYQDDILMQPPEFFSDHACDNKNDVWQLGLLFYELITFNKLFTAKTQY